MIRSPVTTVRCRTGSRRSAEPCARRPQDTTDGATGAHRPVSSHRPASFRAWLAGRSLRVVNPVAPSPRTVQLEPEVSDNARYVLRPQDTRYRTRSVLVAVASNPHARMGTPVEPIMVVEGTPELTADLARTVAAQLLGHVHTQSRIDHRDLVACGPVTVTLPEPSITDADVTEWDLGDGVRLRHLPPFGALVECRDGREFTMTPNRGLRWVGALLALAVELDHAHAVAARAVREDRTGRTVSEDLRDWLDWKSCDFSDKQHALAADIVDLLDELDDMQLDETHVLGLTDPVGALASPLARAWRPGPRTGHRDVARIITELADRHRIPIVCWTADGVLRDLPGGANDLTEEQWYRIGGSDEMVSWAFTLRRQRDTARPVDVRLALVQAGVVCRFDELGADVVVAGVSCSELVLDGPPEETWGLCAAHRPSDPTVVVTATCPASPYVEHTPVAGGVCSYCRIRVHPKADVSSTVQRT